MKRSSSHKLIGLVTLTALFSFGAQAQPAPDVMLSDSAQKMSPHTYLIAGFPNVAIIVGSAGTLVVDTGLGPKNGAIVAQAAAHLSKSTKLYLTTTHFHPEHAAGEAGFPTGTILIRARVQQEELLNDNDSMMTRFRQNPRFAGLLDGVALRKPDILFDKQYVLNLGNVDVTLLYAGPAHTRGDEEIFVKKDGVLITGDVVQNKTGPAFWGQSVGPKDWLETVRSLEALHPKLVIPDHSPPGDGSTLIAQEEDFLKTLDVRARQLKSQGIAAAEAGSMVTEEMKAKYPDWKIGNLSDAVARSYAE